MHRSPAFIETACGQTVSKVRRTCMSLGPGRPRPAHTGNQTIAEITLERHSSVIRTSLGAVFANSIRVGARATSPDVVGVGTRTARDRSDHDAVAEDVDAARGRPAPGEVHALPSLHF